MLRGHGQGLLRPVGLRWARPIARGLRRATRCHSHRRPGWHPDAARALRTCASCLLSDRGGSLPARLRPFADLRSSRRQLSGALPRTPSVALRRRQHTRHTIEQQLGRSRQRSLATSRGRHADRTVAHARQHGAPARAEEPERHRRSRLLMKPVEPRVIPRARLLGTPCRG